jgi:hypothetical protein
MLDTPDTLGILGTRIVAGIVNMMGMANTA